MYLEIRLHISKMIEYPNCNMWPQLVLQELNNNLLKVDIVNGKGPEKNVTFVITLIKNNF